MATISIVGGETPLGREVRDRFAAVLPRHTVQLIGATEEVTTLTEVGGEPAILTPIDESRLRGADLIICAGTPESARRAWALAGTGRPPFVDLTGALEPLPNARLRSPLIERAPPKAAAGTAYVVAHPAAAALALLLKHLQTVRALRQVVVSVFEPVSERGQAGINEMQAQITSLFTFKPLPKQIFDTQVAFALIPEYGEDAPEKLSAIEERIERHLASLLQGEAPLPSLRLIQAPVFHGYSLCLWIEFEERPDLPAVEAELASAQIDVRTAALEAPTNVGTAGQSGVSASALLPDRTNAKAVWLWAAADNYRLMADDAVVIAGQLLRGSSA